jgi:aldose 1-epimerase
MPDGVAVEAFVLTNAAGAEVRLLSYGATLVGMRVPDRHGRPGDVVLGFDSWQRYLGPHPHLGGIVGRFANRIAGSRFQLEGRAEYGASTAACGGRSPSPAVRARWSSSS